MVHLNRWMVLTLIGVMVLLGLITLIVFKFIGLPAPVLTNGSDSASPTVGAYGPLTLTFSTSIQPDSLASRLFLEPSISGKIVWQGSDHRMVTFIPSRPLAPGQRYLLHLNAGVRGQNGLTLQHSLNWAITIRQPEVLLLSPSQSPDLWRVSADGLGRTKLTFTGGKVYDFSASQDGSRIIYAVKNEQDGMDLWKIGRQGGAPRQVLPCGTDWCFNPVFSPDLSQIIYTRRQASGISGSQPGAPHLWTLNPTTLSTDSLISDPSVEGSDPAWSPDGNYLAFIDARAGGMRVLNLQAKKSSFFPADTGAGFTWSPDSRSLFYAQIENAEGQPYTLIDQADVVTQKVVPILGANDTDTLDYSVPDLTPDEAWMVVARRLVGDNPSKQLWLLRSDGSRRQSITNDPLSNFASYHWDFTGSRLVFQRLTLGSSSSRPQVAVWNRQDGKFTTLSEDAFQPRWIP